jgi:O-antigen/teichoic acid export membrane protein
MTPPPPRATALAADAGWNFAALAATTGVGAATMFLIAAQMGAPALGVFAQLYAVHVIGAQLAVLGIHDSTQKHVAELGSDRRAGDAIVSSALRVVLISSGALALFLGLAAEPTAAFVGSPDVGRGLYLAAPGLVAFALNKVLFGALNGRGELRRYASMQLLRAAFVLIAIGTIVGLDLPDFAVGGIFAAAELVLLPCLLAAVRPELRAADAAHAGWWRRHLHFGGRGLVNGILLETHLRVDVMTLSYFVSDRVVGIYAFAGLFAEGVYQVPVVIRTVAYPSIVRLASRHERAALARMTRRLALAGGTICAAVATAVLVLYPYIAAWFNPEFVTSGGPVLQILLAGMAVYAFVLPFDQLLLQSGLPGRQSLLMALYVGANVVLNIAWIPGYGLIGAAAATAVSMVVAALLLLLASWLWLGYRGGVLLHRAPAA